MLSARVTQPCSYKATEPGLTGRLKAMFCDPKLCQIHRRLNITSLNFALLSFNAGFLKISQLKPNPLQRRTPISHYCDVKVRGKFLLKKPVGTLQMSFQCSSYPACDTPNSIVFQQRTYVEAFLFAIMGGIVPDIVLAKPKSVDCRTNL